MIYQVECDNGHKYTQETEGLTYSSEESWKRPYVCGACGSKDIRVWAMVYDALTIAIKDRLEASRKREGWETDVNGPGYVEKGG